jgi:hypothetical protein
MTGKTAQKLAFTGFALLSPMLALAQQFSNADNELAVAAMRQANSQMGGAAIVLVVIIVAALIFATLRDKRRQELFSRFAEKGQEIPRELLPLPPSRLRELRRATWLSSLGLGLGLVLYITTGDWRVAAWCLILLFLATASFINAALFYGSSGSERRIEGRD